MFVLTHLSGYLTIFAKQINICFYAQSLAKTKLQTKLVLFILLTRGTTS